MHLNFIEARIMRLTSKYQKFKQLKKGKIKEFLTLTKDVEHRQNFHLLMYPSL